MINFKTMQEDLQPTMRHAAERLDARGTNGVNATMAMALLVAVAAVLFAWQGEGYHAGFHTLHQVAGGALPDRLWMWITRLGDERLLLVLSLLFARYRPELFWTMIVAALIAILYNRGLKVLVDAMRPPAVMDLEQLNLIGPALRNHSFPSGHTVSVFVFAGVLFAFARGWRARVLLMVGAGLVGLSRVALGVHWPHDVLAGAFGGLFTAALGVWLSYHWRAGLKAKVHLWLLLLPLLGMVLVLLEDGGNPHTPVLTVLVVFAMATQLMLDYRSYRR